MEDTVQVLSLTCPLPSAFYASPQLCLPRPLSPIKHTRFKFPAAIHWMSVSLLLFSMRPGVSLHTAGHHFVICVIILQAADRGLTPPPPPGLARPSGSALPSSDTTGGRKGSVSFSSGMPIPNSPAVGSPHSQPGQQFERTRGLALALAVADRGGFGSGLRPDMLKRPGNGDGKPFGEHASGSDRGQGVNRQADTNRPGLSNSLQTPPITTDSTPQGQPGSELGDSNVGDGQSSGVAPTPASSSTRPRGLPAHLVARLSKNPFEDDHAQADTHHLGSLV